MMHTYLATPQSKTFKSQSTYSVAVAFLFWHLVGADHKNFFLFYVEKYQHVAGFSFH